MPTCTPTSAIPDSLHTGQRPPGSVNDGAASRGRIYGVFALLIALGFFSLKFTEASALQVGIFALAALYGVGACLYLMVNYARSEGVSSLLEGGLHPRHGLLSTTPRTRRGAIGTTLAYAAVAAISAWAMQVEPGDVSVQDAHDVLYLFVFGTSMFTLTVCGYPIAVVDWLVVRHWHTTTPPPQVAWAGLAVGSVLGLLAGSLAVAWALTVVPGDTGWFTQWIGWLPTAAIAINALGQSYRHLMVSAWQARLNEQTLRADAAVQARRLAEAQLATLQAQIEPHFLYNTLASVQFLVRKDATAADFLLTQLIRYLRHAMPRMRQTMSTLQQEFELADAFLQIARVRMGGRLTVQVELAERLHGLPFPPLVLQTLVENALKHGVEPKLGPVHITVAATVHGADVCIEVCDNGIGLGRAGTAGSGMGLANIRAGLVGIYGKQAQLGIVDLPHGGVRASVLLRDASHGPVTDTPSLQSRDEVSAA